MEFITSIGDTLSAKLGGLLPGVLGALILLVVGLLVAMVIRNVVKSLLNRTQIDEKIGSKLNTSFRIDNFVAKLVYYLIVLFVLLAVLDMMGINQVLEPLQAMLGDFLGYLPNIIGAGIISFAGYVIATLVSEAVGFISNSLESASQKIGLSGSMNLTKIVKQLVFVFVFIPILIVALDTLKMTAISEPATDMLNSLLAAIPKIIAAAMLLGIFYIIGKYVVTIVTDLLSNLGIDQLAIKMGLSNFIGNTSLSKLIGNVAFFFLMFAGIIAAADKLEITAISDILNTVFHISGKVFFGLIILAVGGFIANIAAKAMSTSADNQWMSPMVKFAIIGIFLAFSLHTMGIAESIVNLAFGLTLGSVALAFALSFGLGGRAAAGKQMEQLFNKMNKKEKDLEMMN